MKKTLIIFITLILNIQFKQIVPTCNKTAYDQFIKALKSDSPTPKKPGEEHDSIKNYIECRRAKHSNSLTDLNQEQQEQLQKNSLEHYYCFADKTIESLLKKIVENSEDSDSINQLVKMKKRLCDCSKIYEFMEFSSTKKVKESFAKIDIENIAPGLTRYLLQYKKSHSLSLDNVKELYPILNFVMNKHNLHRVENIYLLYSMKFLISKEDFHNFTDIFIETIQKEDIYLDNL